MNERLKGVLYLLPCLLIFGLGDVVFTLFALGLGLIAYFELHQAFTHKKMHLPILSGILTAVVLGIISFCSINNNTLVICATIELISLIVCAIEKENRGKNIAITILSMLYAFIPYWLLSRIELMPNGRFYTIAVFLIAFSTDIFAMIAGKHFGKHLLTKISPKKTVEGSIGGIVGATIVCIIYGICSGAAMPVMWFLNLETYLLLPLNGIVELRILAI